VFASGEIIAEKAWGEPSLRFQPSFQNIIFMIYLSCSNSFIILARGGILQHFASTFPPVANGLVVAT
jgi:hypothetical protein